MKEKQIMLAGFADAKRFVLAAGKCNFDIDIFYNRVVIDAKSILGVLSLDLTRVLTVRMHEESLEFEKILDTFAPNIAKIA